LITLSTITPDTEIWYTIDDTIPSRNGSTSILYTAPFTLEWGKVTLRAIAVDINEQRADSNILVTTYHVLMIEFVPPPVYSHPVNTNPNTAGPGTFFGGTENTLVPHFKGLNTVVTEARNAWWNVPMVSPVPLNSNTFVTIRQGNREFVPDSLYFSYSIAEGNSIWGNFVDSLVPADLGMNYYGIYWTNFTVPMCADNILTDINYNAINNVAYRPLNFYPGVYKLAENGVVKKVVDWRQRASQNNLTSPPMETGYIRTRFDYYTAPMYRYPDILIFTNLVKATYKSRFGTSYYFIFEIEFSRLLASGEVIPVKCHYVYSRADTTIFAPLKIYFEELLTLQGL
jgi:hypothetical protein